MSYFRMTPTDSNQYSENGNSKGVPSLYIVVSRIVFHTIPKHSMQPTVYKNCLLQFVRSGELQAAYV